MAYTTPVYNRALSDILARNSKAYLNLADWQRIDNNAEHVGDLLLSIFVSALITQNTVATMTTASIPDTDDVNDLAENIEAIREWIATNHPTSTAATDADFAEVKDDYTSPLDLTFTGYSYPFQVVNLWEKVLDIANDWLDGLEKVRYARTGVSGCGRGLTRNNSFRG